MLELCRQRKTWKGCKALKGCKICKACKDSKMHQVYNCLRYMHSSMPSLQSISQCHRIVIKYNIF